MSISFGNTFNNIAQGMAGLNQINFINKYGNYASGYKHLSPIGENKHFLHIIVAILSIVASIILFVNSPEERDAKNNPIERSTIKKIFRTSAWILLIVFVLSVVYGGYLHFALYLPEYNDWFQKLPADAKNDINIIHGINQIVNNMRNYDNNMRR